MYLVGTVLELVLELVVLDLVTHLVLVFPVLVHWDGTQLVGIVQTIEDSDGGAYEDENILIVGVKHFFKI